MIEVSVITPVYNESLSIKQLLDALLRQTYSKDKFEVIIIDDDSSDDTKQIVLTFAKESVLNLRFIVQSHRGQGEARNKGIETAKGKVLAFTDGDCIPDRDWVEQCFNQVIIENHQLVSGYTYCRENAILPWKISPAGRRWITANLAVRKSIIGNTRFRLLNCEETDFVFQLDDKFSKKIKTITNKMKVDHPVKTLTLPGVVRFARRRRQEVIFVKLHGRKAYTSMHPLYRPILFNRFSILFITVITAIAIALFFGYKGILFDLLVLILGGVLFVWFGYKVVISNGPLTTITLKDRFRTLFYFLVYNLVYLAARIEGSIKYRKVMV